MAVGRNGQVIMAFLNLDIGAVTTGRHNYRLGELADSISGSRLYPFSGDYREFILVY
jgi:hypothetical protein